MSSGLSAEQLALLAHKLKQKQAKSGAAGIPRRQLSAPAPLSFAQQRLWLLDRLEPGSSAYTIPLAVRLVGALDSSALARAASEVVRRHEPLRTTFVEQGGTPWQRVAPPGPVPVPTIDLGGLAEGTRGETARRLRSEQDRLAFDLAVGPLYRLRLVRLGAAEHLLLIDFHHTVADGWSLAVCFNEISALYDAFVAGLASPLAELPIQYGDFAVWQREWLTGEVLARQVAYWRAALAGAPAALELPTDRPRPAVPGHRGDAVMVELPPALSEALRELSSAAGVSLFMTLFAAFAVLLGRLSGQDDLVVGSPAAGRSRVETEGLIGLFLNTLVLRVDTAGDPTCRELLARVKEVVLGAYAHQEIPFERLLEELQPERHLSRAPLFQVLFNMLSVPPARLALRGLDAEILPWVEPDAKLDVTLYVVDRQETLRLDLVYSVELFDRARAEEMVRQYECLLRQAVEAPEARIGSYTLVTEAATALIPGALAPIAAWPGPITECFAARAARHPERICLVSEDRSVTYGELDAEIRGLARQLVSVDLRKGEVVAVWAHRDPGLVSAVMGVLAAGGVFLILDPAYPAARLAEYLRLARPRAWVAVAGAPEVPAEVEEALGELGGIPRLTADGAMPADFAPVALGPDDAACLTFTSGSSGRPKGVVGRHGPLTWFYPFMAARFGLGADDRFGMLSALSHDPLQRDLFTPLFFGASLAVPDPARMASPGYLAGWVRRHAVSVLHLTPAMLELLTASAEEQAAGEREMPSLARAFVVGDVLKRSDVLRLMAVAPRLACFNLYGSTETQRSVSYFAVSRTPGPGREALPLGRGMDGVDLLVINRAGRLAGIGEVGEIVLRGPHLARGYLGDDALTDERFIADPLGSGTRAYKTGDLGRYLPDGNAEMVGRADFQVKLRGFRIELGEIEAALKRQPGVEECVAVLRDDRPGDSGNPGNRRLVAYLVAEGAVDKSALRGRLARELPDYMVPGALVVLPALPLTPTGKIDRLALPAPPARELEGGGPGRELSPVEQLLAGLWSDLLEQPSVAPGDDFFALGGHSLLATRMISRVRDLLGVELGLRTLFEQPTLEQLAQAIERARGMAQVRPPIVARPQDEPTHLSFGQKRLWFLDQLEPGSAAYLLAGALRLDGNLRIDALAGAFSEIVRRHQVLRTSFAAERGEPVAVVAPPRPVALPAVDLGGLPAAVREPAAMRLVAEHCARPIDLAMAPVLRLGLVRLSEETHLLLVAVHHIAADGWSLAVLTRELVALYGALLAGEPSPLPELAVQYADFAHAQESWFGGDALAVELAFWKAALAGAPPALALPTDFPRPALPTGGGGQVTLALGRELTARVEATARRLGVTPFMLLLAAFAVLLSRHANQDDLVVGSPVAGRNHSALEPLVGFFVNTLPLRVRVGGGAFAALLAAVKETALSAYAHQDLPFEKLVEELMPERHLNRAPVFQVTFALQNLPFAELALAGLAVSAVPVRGRSHFDLDLALVPLPDGYLARLDYSTDLFTAVTARRIVARYRNLLAGIVAPASPAISELPLLSAAERLQLLVEWNQSGAAYPRDASIPGLVAELAARAPHRLAVVAGRDELTYGELLARATLLARRLAGLGVGPGSRVVLLVERSLDSVAASLAVLLAGGCYVPLDPNDPPDRVRFVLADSAAAVVVVRDALPAGLADLAAAVLVLSNPGGVEAPLPAEMSAELPAYVIYTSGSTGRPKGVVVPHRAVTRLVLGTNYVAIEPGDRVSHLANPAFDAAVFEVWGALLNGAALVVVPRDAALDGERLGRELDAKGVTKVFVTTALFHHLVREAPHGLSGRREVFFGGEAIDPAALALCLAQPAPPRRLVNLYGPTESGVVATWHEVTAAEPASPVPIGLPISNTTVHLVDRWGQPAGVGVPGELTIGGDGLATGYLGRPDLTAERFVPDPFGQHPGARLYRTGDLARRNPRGEIEFLGRIDRQVKVRGFRIELGEIESALAAQPEIAAAVVVAREDEPGDRRLVGYLVPAGGDLDVARVREALRLGLPDHMVPSAFVTLASLPLSPNGKVDRRALPAPGRGEARLAQIVAPRTPLERRVAELWAEALGAGAIGVDDSFWDLGGHSLLATKVLARVRRACGVDLPLRTLFEHPTLAAFAAAVGAARAAGQAGAIPRRERTVPAALSFAQERLWLLDRIEPGNTAYTMAFPARWSGGFDEAAFCGALAEIVRRHEALRTSFAEIDGVPVQVAAAPGPVSLPWIDLGGLPDAAAQREGERLAAAWQRIPFDLARGPLLRVALVELGRDQHLVLLAVHHVVFDGWSVDVFFAELTALYRAATEGRPSPLPELPVQYADFAVWQRERLTGGLLDEQLGYWRLQLAGAPPALELPTDRLRPAVPTHRGEALWHALPEELTASLHELSRRSGASLFMTLLAGFNLLLARLVGQHDIVVGSPSAGRERVETEGLIGLFLNTLVLRTDLSGNPTFAALLARVKETALDAYRYQEIPFERLLAELQPERQLSRAPIFQVLFNMVTLELEPPQLPGLAIAPLVAGEPGAKYDWTLYLREAGGRLVIQSVHDVDLFDRPRVEEMLRQLAGVLTQAVGRPEAPIGSFSLVTREAAALLPDPAAPLREDWFGAVHHGLTRSAARDPHRLALLGGDESWTYAELEARSNQLARSLIARGVERGEVVALWAHRCPSLVWAVMGTLKAGATMMILDPAYPAARLADYLAIGRPKAWIAVPGAPEPPADVLAALPPLRVLSLLSRGMLRGGSGEEGRGGEGRVEVAVGPDDAACLTFTSGSTGKPKGVVGRHGPLTHFYPFMAERFALSSADRFGMLSALSHDPLQRDLFTPLWLGAALCVPDPERLGDPGYLAQWVQESGVTVLHLTPAMLDLLVAAAELRGPLPSLRRAFVVGDLLKQTDVERLYRVAPNAICYNLYGSTETQRSVACFEVPRGARLGREVLPVGRGMEGTQLLVLNRAGRLAGVGELGEIHMRGPHLAAGYLADEALTAERFLANPFGGGDRVYKTGDLGRYLPNGDAEVLGRADFQVKIRGFRIELGEVEAALLSHPGVDECVTVVREERPGDRRLVAYVVGERAPQLEELRAFLAVRLPDYMLPQAVVTLPALPVTPTGKVDRRALPAPAANEARYVAPRSAVEAVLAAAWAEVLRVARAGVHDNFFALGGDSILAIKLVSLLRQQGWDLPPREVFLHQTVAAQAALMSPGSAGVPPASPPPLAEVSQEELDDVLAEL